MKYMYILFVLFLLGCEEATRVKLVRERFDIIDIYKGGKYSIVIKNDTIFRFRHSFDFGNITDTLFIKELRKCE